MHRELCVEELERRRGTMWAQGYVRLWDSFPALQVNVYSMTL